MQNYTQPALLKQLQQDLGRKYQVHGTRIEEIWRSWGPAKRAEALRAGAANGEVLRHSSDTSMGNVCMIIPEINLQQLAGPDPDFFLSRLRHRATHTLHQQYLQGPDGEPGDGQVIRSSMLQGLRHSKVYPYELTRLMDDLEYGESFKVRDAATYQKTMSDLSYAINAGAIAPRATAELVMQRQLYALQSFNILVEDILDLGSTSRDTSAPKKHSRKKPSQSQATPAKPEKLPVSELLLRAQDQKTAAEDYLTLCRTEPAFLTPIVNMWFMSRPELLPDEKGRRLPLYTDKYKSVAFFEVLHSAVVEAAVWEYVCRLLQGLVDKPRDKTFRAIVLQELSNVCQFEYNRAQKLFKRYVHTFTAPKYFRRSSAGDNKAATRVVMTVKPESLAQKNPLLQYVLTLTDTKTDALKAIPWIQKLDDLPRTHPTLASELTESESEALAGLSVTAAFIQSLATSLPLPPANSKKGQAYLPKIKALISEVEELSDEVDLSEYVVPIDNLLEPGIAREALATLDNFIVENAGVGLGFLYDGLAEEVMTSVQAQSTETEQALEKELDAKLSLTEPQSTAFMVEQRREKAKTRPAHSSVYSIVPTEAPPTETESSDPIPVHKVKQATFDVFSTLFSKTESQGSVTWAAFQSAMTDLKFSVIPRFGSIFTFVPPKDFSPPRSFTIHRPHHSRIEGYKLIYFASRLKRIYGWDEVSFTTA
ncbi:hypothetical protein BJX68DRAFT_229467 [Aspergillus pseudodeflectus]|uniref:Ipa protein n=1 Tax=Aspergillus pseudodeflectus TaxID=176178 RepID=A0ABR4L003_9EURO